MTQPCPSTLTVAPSALERAAKALIDNINEFGAVTDGEFIDAVQASLTARPADPLNTSPEPVSKSPENEQGDELIERLRSDADNITVSLIHGLGGRAATRTVRATLLQAAARLKDLSNQTGVLEAVVEQGRVVEERLVEEADKALADLEAANRRIAELEAYLGDEDRSFLARLADAEKVMGRARDALGACVPLDIHHEGFDIDAPGPHEGTSTTWIGDAGKLARSSRNEIDAFLQQGVKP